MYSAKICHKSFGKGYESSGFLRGPQKLDEISKMTWILSSKRQTNYLEDSDRIIL